MSWSGELGPIEDGVDSTQNARNMGRFGVVEVCASTMGVGFLRRYETVTPSRRG